MEFQQVLRDRRSVRSYNDQPVEPALLQQVIEQAVLAPSANNRQPWAFWVISGRDHIQTLSDRAQKWLLEELEADQSTGAFLERLSEPGYKLLYRAPALVLITATSIRSQDDEDCCVAAMSFMLAARDAGLGTCWIGLARPWFNLPLIKRELGVPAEASVVAPIVIGYPTAWPVAPDRAKAKIHWL